VIKVVGGSKASEDWPLALEHPKHLLDVVGLFAQGLRIPFAALGGEEIAAIDVDGAGHPRNRIDHRMDDVGAEHLG
jgi:hypothetical protein